MSKLKLLCFGSFFFCFSFPLYAGCPPGFVQNGIEYGHVTCTYGDVTIPFDSDEDSVRATVSLDSDLGRELLSLYPQLNGYGATQVSFNYVSRFLNLYLEDSTGASLPGSDFEYMDVSVWNLANVNPFVPGPVGPTGSSGSSGSPVIPLPVNFSVNVIATILVFAVGVLAVLVLRFAWSNVRENLGTQGIV